MIHKLSEMVKMVDVSEIVMIRHIYELIKSIVIT